jgi:hypothetical protein
VRLTLRRILHPKVLPLAKYDIEGCQNEAPAIKIGAAMEAEIFPLNGIELKLLTTAAIDSKFQCMLPCGNRNCYRLPRSHCRNNDPSIATL